MTPVLDGIPTGAGVADQIKLSCEGLRTGEYPQYRRDLDRTAWRPGAKSGLPSFPDGSLNLPAALDSDCAIFVVVGPSCASESGG